MTLSFFLFFSHGEIRNNGINSMGKKWIINPTLTKQNKMEKQTWLSCHLNTLMIDRVTHLPCVIVLGKFTNEWHLMWVCRMFHVLLKISHLEKKNPSSYYRQHKIWCLKVWDPKFFFFFLKFLSFFSDLLILLLFQWRKWVWL